jgi:hypothetical protein
MFGDHSRYQKGVYYKGMKLFSDATLYHRIKAFELPFKKAFVILLLSCPGKKFSISLKTDAFAVTF